MRLVALRDALFDDALAEASGSTRSARRRRSSSAATPRSGDPVGRDRPRVHRLLAGRLQRRSRRPRDPDWPWPEPILTYENALPVRALIVAGAYHRSRSMLDAGLARLDWLIDIQTVDGHFSPIGNGWWPRGGERATFDQQPIEATSLLLAAEAAYTVTGLTSATALPWSSPTAGSSGENDLGVPVADLAHGACFDGLTRRGTNKNQGAESTLMWLTALEHMRAHRTPAMQPAATPDTARELAVSAT